MATYASLTNEQKQLLDSYTTMLRAWAGEQARSNNHARVINDDYNGQISAILNSLDAGEVIPQRSGLAGAASLTKEDVITVTSHAQNILTNMVTHINGFDTSSLRQLWTKAAGAPNMIG